MAKHSGKKKEPSDKKPTKTKKAKQQAATEVNEPIVLAIDASSKPTDMATTQWDSAPDDIQGSNSPTMEREPGLVRVHALALKDFFGERLNLWKTEMDPEKFESFKREAKKIIKNGLYYIAGISAVVVIMLILELHSQGRVMPGVKVGTTEVGYLKQEEAQQKIVAELQKYLKTPFFINYEGNTIEVPSEELGIHLNIEQTLQKIPTFDIQEEGVFQLAVSTFASPQIAMNYALDGDTVMRSLEQKLHLTEARARNARFVWNEDQLIVEPEKNGIAIDREKLMTDLRSRIDTVSTAPIIIETVEEAPRITAAQLEKDKDNLVALLNKQLTLHYEANSFKLKLIDHLDAVSFREKNALKFKEGNFALPLVITEGQVARAQSDDVQLTSNIQIEVDPEKLEPILAENILKDIEIPTSPANIFTNEKGEVMIEGKGEDGRSVSRSQLVEALELAANYGIEDVPVPVHIEHAPLTISEDLQAMGIKELVSTGHSSYYGSPTNRMFNIGHGIQRFNGVIIKPGEEFSFNTQLGDVDGAHGYKLEHVIKKNKVELEMGGGICQVSTTAYRAALLAGLPIAERREHTWKISYYGQSMGHGLDATIYIGGQDLKFVNDTPGAILIQSYAEDSNAYFKFYGTNDGRMITMDGPYGGGLTYRWNRTIKDPEGKETTEEIWSHYHPIPPPEPPKPIAQKPAAPADHF